MEHINYIIGPTTFVILKPNIQCAKKIYMFGETHFGKRNECKDECNIYKCIEIIPFLKNLFDYADKNNINIDFMLETNQKTRLINNTYMDILHIYRTFYKEFNGNNTYKNVTFDNSDIRHTNNYSLFSYLDFFGNIDIDVKNYIINNNKNGIVKIINFLYYIMESDIILKMIIIFLFSDNFIIEMLELETNNEDVNKFIEDTVQYMRQYIIKHNDCVYSKISLLTNILMKENKNIYQKLKIFIINELYAKNNELNKTIGKSINYLYNGEFYEFHKNIQYEKLFLTQLISILLDAYLISYFFVDKCKKNYDYIIFYFGSAHIDRISRFFKEIGFEMLYYVSNSKNCIDVTNVNFLDD